MCIYIYTHVYMYVCLYIYIMPEPRSDKRSADTAVGPRSRCSSFVCLFVVYMYCCLFVISCVCRRSPKLTLSPAPPSSLGTLRRAWGGQGRSCCYLLIAAVVFYVMFAFIYFVCYFCGGRAGQKFGRLFFYNGEII